MNKNCIISISLFLILSIRVNAQDSLQLNFDMARTYLAKREMVDAIKSLRPIYVKDPDNANINFLIGAAYTSINGEESKALFHLKKAIQDISVDYKAGTLEEKSAPLNTYYYLILAFVEAGQCNEAHDVFLTFQKQEGKIDQYYIKEADRQLQKCPNDKKVKNTEWKKLINPPEAYDPGYIEYTPEPKKIDSVYLSNRGIVTKPLEYTTDAPLYGVQIGSSMNPVPLSRFDKVKNVDVFIDNDGKIRYVVGHFAYYKQAESLLKTIREKGYADAFVVNVNDERRYSQEVISFHDRNLRASIQGKIEYYIQLGAFKEEVPEELMELYLDLDGIKELSYNDFTLMAIGPFEKYNETLNQKDKLMMQTDGDISESFVIAFNQGVKVSLEEAINKTDK